MKVIQIMPLLGIGGAEIVCENLTYSLMELGVEVIVVSFYDQRTVLTDRMEKAGVDIRYLGKKPGLDFSMIGKLRRLFKKERPDAIHTHINTMYYAIPAALGIVKRKIHTVHSLADKECEENIAKKCNRFCCKYLGVTPVALSEAVRESIHKVYSIKEERIPIVYNGIDLKKCQPKVDYHLGDRFTILHIGRLSEEKNHLMLIDAFADFHQKYANSQLQLIGEGPMRGQIEQKIADCGLQDSVLLMGAQSNVYGYLNAADVFVLPSVYEGMPMVLIEAMGTGLPIVASRVGGIPDMLKDNESALLTDVDKDQLVLALENVINSETKRASLGQNAKDASVRFSSAMMGKEYVKLYK